MLHVFPTLGLYKTKEVWCKFMPFAEDWAMQRCLLHIQLSLLLTLINYRHRQSRSATL